jgi:hypothetical protein
LVTSLDLAKRTEILPGLRQVRWDLIIVDEAHRMSWSPPARKTARYALGELLRDISDHMLLLTATPHKGDPVNFSLFLQLLDADAYTDVRSIREAMDRRRQELQQQRSLTLQAVERLTPVLVLPHPDREAPKLRHLRQNLETEATAMQVVMEHERSLDRQVYDVHDKNLGYDIISLDLNSGELRLIEVKGIGDAEGSVLLTPNERRVAEDRRDCYWLYVVTHCNTTPRLREPIKDPARLQWTEVVKVAHYCLDTQSLK